MTIVDTEFAVWFENVITPASAEEFEVVEFSPKNTIAREDALFIWRASWAAATDVMKAAAARAVQMEASK